MKSDMDSMSKNQVWDLVDPPKGIVPIRNKWIFKRKIGADGKMDVKTAFLNGYIEEDIFMDQSKGFESKDKSKVCKLMRSIYGLKHDSRSWNRHCNEAVKSFGFIKNEDEPCVYKKASGSMIAFLVLYVDDILLMGNDVGMLSSVKVWLSNTFSIKDLGEATYILGIRIYRDRPKRLIGLSQALYLDKSDVDDRKSISGYIFTCNGGAVSWKSSKQETTADSTTKAEYIAAFDAAKEAIWIRKFVTELSVVPSISSQVELYCDNTGAIVQAKEPRSHQKSKRIERRYHIIREIIRRGDLAVQKVASADNVADPLKKAMMQHQLEKYLEKMGLRYYTEWL
ncbi:hypothetical protein CRG98_035947 [Punica granatum]|uniref:Reverse transcriptase Ty1/copia-type domain-containing protein n=1 Tax=Punica granatum TaxID=22663 RepID=A0A2I0IIS5_PUNGR|nr:hypothetical protein CRG98_035947 [Punica granatum]